MSDYPMLISNKLHSFRNFIIQTYSFFLEKANLLVCKADRKIFLPYFFAEC